jgi:hypothetical protein
MTNHEPVTIAGVPAERFVDEIESKVMTDGGSDR